MDRGFAGLEHSFPGQEHSFTEAMPKLLGNEGWEYSRTEPKEESGNTLSQEENNQHHVNWLTIKNSYDILTKKIEE